MKRFYFLFFPKRFIDLLVGLLVLFAFSAFCVLLNYLFLLISIETDKIFSYIVNVWMYVGIAVIFTGYIYNSLKQKLSWENISVALLLLFLYFCMVIY